MQCQMPSTGVVRTRNAVPAAVEEVAENGRKLPEVRMPKYNTMQSTNTKHTQIQIYNDAQIQYKAMYKFKIHTNTNTQRCPNTIRYKVQTQNTHKYSTESGGDLYCRLVFIVSCVQ